MLSPPNIIPGVVVRFPQLPSLGGTDPAPRSRLSAANTLLIRPVPDVRLQRDHCL
ncbi:MAG: hypothetical protein IGR92_01985 [Leptolyngbyaceae cyanobacterium T60_A2020_046]|nr:hypothetical protein [Leptolyngbyaceae cyanobacterium T60_A2020_046]